MVNISIKSEGIITVGEKLKKENTNLESSFKKCAKKVDKLPNYWKGKQAKQDIEKFQTIKKQFINDACKVVDSYVKALLSIAREYEYVEEDNKKIGETISISKTKKIVYKTEEKEDNVYLRYKFK